MADQMCNPRYIYPDSPLYETMEQKFKHNQNVNSANQALTNYTDVTSCKISVYQQRLFIHKNGLCFSCLQKNHTATNCSASAPVICTICNLKHPTSLHCTRRYDNSNPHDLETCDGLLTSRNQHSDLSYSS